MTKPGTPRPEAGSSGERLDSAGFPIVFEDRAPMFPQRGVVHRHVVAAVGLLRTRVAEPWTLSSLAAEVHLSCSQLVRAFDATVGMSPMAYLRQMRLQQMARLLRSTDLSIAGAARAVGWTDANYASRCFRTSRAWRPPRFGVVAQHDRASRASLAA